MLSGVYGTAAAEERAAERRSQSASAFIVTLAMVAAVATVLLISSTNSRPTDLFSQTIQFSNGQRAELSRKDFVPLSMDGNSADTKQARTEIAGLYAAAGMEMRVHRSRQQELAQVRSDPPPTEIKLVRNILK